MTEQRHILFYSRSYPPTVGGMEKYAQDMHALFSQIESVESKVHGRYKKGLLSYLISVFFHSLSNTKRARFIYCNDLLTSLFCIPAAKIFKRDIITTVYGLDISYFNIRPKGVSDLLRKRLYKLVVSFVAKRVTHAISISENTSLIADQLQIPNSIITPYINLPRREVKKVETRKIKYFPNELPTLLLFGRFVKRKGAAWFLRDCYPQLQTKFNLLLGGYGEDLPILQALIDENNFENCKLFCEVSEEEKVNLYETADIFVMPNIPVEDNYEGFGITVIEASYYGCFVVASNLDGIPSAIAGPETGSLFEPENSKSLTEILLEHQDDKFDREKISSQTTEKYSSSTKLNELKQLLDELAI
jgi:glycosyltransferase involved in cell wall biosynthesis